MKALASLAALTAVVALALAAPAAANDVPRTGQKIGLLCMWFGTCSAQASYAADTPFHVAHGYCDLPDLFGGIVDPSTRFELKVDGEAVPLVTDLDVAFGRDPALVCKTNIANFRHGLPAGTYTFTGRWYAFGQPDIVAVRTVTFS